MAKAKKSKSAGKKVKKTVVVKAGGTRVGDMLRKARESTGISQEELAHRLKTKRTAISRIENHADDIKLSTLERVVQGPRQGPQGQDRLIIRLPGPRPCGGPGPLPACRPPSSSTIIWDPSGRSVGRVPAPGKVRMLLPLRSLLIPLVLAGTVLAERKPVALGLLGGVGGASLWGKDVEELDIRIWPVTGFSLGLNLPSFLGLETDLIYSSKGSGFSGRETFRDFPRAGSRSPRSRPIAWTYPSCSRSRLPPAAR